MSSLPKPRDVIDLRLIREIINLAVTPAEAKPKDARGSATPSKNKAPCRPQRSIGIRIATPVNAPGLSPTWEAPSLISIGASTGNAYS